MSIALRFENGAVPTLSIPLDLPGVEIVALAQDTEGYHLTTPENWRDEILNYFHHRHTSGFVEGFNNKVKVLKRRCYGLLNVAHFFQRLYLDLEGYRLFACAH